MTYQQKLSRLLTIATAFTCMWFAGFYRPQNSSTPTISSVPDAYMENVHAIVYNKDGSPSLKITTPKMKHFAEGDTTQLLNPALTLFHNGPQPWTITSKFATATKGIDNIHFSTDVTIQHAGDQSNPLTLIKTPTLEVQTVDKTADTSDLITLSQPNITVQAIGMHADLNEGNVKLLSQAHGEYQPNA